MTDKFVKILPLSVVLAQIIFFSCDSKVPVITSIDPAIGRMGEVITLTGLNFGESQEESYVTIAGISPTGSSYYLWQENLIMVRVPEFGESGLVYVYVMGKKSNGILFSNSATVPRPVEGEELGLGPRIVSVSPQTGVPGTVITITGNNFGISREGGGVFFSWNYESPSFNSYIVREPEFIEVSEIELGYVSWNTREIRVRLPDGDVSGNIEVRTPHGRAPVFFDVSGKPGYKNFADKRSYTVNYSVDIRVLEATRPNTLYLWIPMPVSTPSQRNVSLVSRSIEPFIENHRGVSLFKLENLGMGFNQSVNLSFRVEVYAVETEITPQSVRQETTPLSQMYTQSSSLIPSDSPQIRATVSSVVGREQNPYIKARHLYNWIIENIQIGHSPADSIEAAIELKQADTYTTALLYAAMARSAGIPCIPVAGVLIDQNGQTLRHYWAEFWIDGFGWVPADPAMGAGAVWNFLIDKENLAGYYFGNIDNQRIAFSRGELTLSQMENKGRPVTHTNSYSLQTIWEEASGGLESYTSLWGDIVISGIYVQ
ncbi:MAG: IPT/TIG domain-containing protein [Treponema sp.]|jgi:transglutaminase-like putative cysteine protease|nr:IPT/TIG domain-containing protein [Treponema sp.]